MSAGRLTDFQWLVLWELDDHPASFFRRNIDWFWITGASQLKVSQQIMKLAQRDLIVFAGPADPNPLNVTGAGKLALLQRDYMDVLNRVNGT